MKNVGHGAVEISVGDTKEEEKDERFFTDTHGSVCGEIRRSIAQPNRITKEQEIAEFLQSMEENIGKLKE